MWDEDEPSNDNEGETRFKSVKELIKDTSYKQFVEEYGLMRTSNAMNVIGKEYNVFLPSALEFLYPKIRFIGPNLEVITSTIHKSLSGLDVVGETYNPKLVWLESPNDSLSKLDILLSIIYSIGVMDGLYRSSDQDERQDSPYPYLYARCKGLQFLYQFLVSNENDKNIIGTELYNDLPPQILHFYQLVKAASKDQKIDIFAQYSTENILMDNETLVVILKQNCYDDTIPYKYPNSPV